MEEKKKNIVFFLVITGISLLSLFYLISKIGKVWGGGHKTIYAKFENIKGLAEKAEVRLGGVKVGYVDKMKIELDKEKISVKLEMKIKKDTPVRKDFEAQIRMKSLLGEKFVELVPTGTGDLSLAPDGFTIEKTKILFEPDELIMSLEPFIKSLDPQAIREIANIAPELVRNINPLIQNTSELIEKLDKTLEASGKIVSRLEKTIVVGNEMLELFAYNKNNIEKLLRVSPELVQNINNSIPELLTTVKSVNETLAYLNQNQKDSFSRIFEITPQVLSETQKLLNNLNNMMPEFQKVMTEAIPMIRKLNETLEKGVKVRVF
jgi:phospholipid/cholesterol/gamma-HCH transport system substrate-binding protein